jgi:hypothetical protein
VILHGFVQSVQHNGKTGKITEFVGEGVWAVKLDLPPSTILRIRSDKIHAIGPSAPVSSDVSARSPVSADVEPLPQLKILINHIRQNPQYTLAALQEGVYVIGMKDQFNAHGLKHSPLAGCIQYIVDDMGFVLYDRTAASSKSVDQFGPYFIEQYILMEALSKQEVAQNVLDYYVNHKQALQDSLSGYSEEQGKGFICWRFLMKDSGKGKACGSPVLRALARKAAAAPDLAPAAPATSLLQRVAGFF